MDTTPKSFIVEHSSFEQAASAAAFEAASTMSTPMPVIVYKQANRTFLVTSFPLGYLVERVQIDTLKKGDDPDEHINRPMMPEHVRGITKYLVEQPEYILPSITLCSRETLRCHIPVNASASKMGFVVVPVSVLFDVTDGQHRIRGIQEALRSKPELRNDGIAITIVQESEIEKMHQDFVDCAQVKPIPAALLTVFNQRDPLARFARLLVEKLPSFKGRIEKAGKTVGKNSINLFTMNQVRAGLAELLTGDSMVASPTLKKAVEERLTEDDYQFHEDQVVEFFRIFTASNPQWHQVADLGPSAARDRLDAATLRSEFLHFTATGLLIMGRVGFHIHKIEDPVERERLITLLARLDWSRQASLWKGNVVSSDGKVVTSRVPVETAIARVKQALGMNLTGREAGRIEGSRPSGAEDQAEMAVGA